MKSVHSGRFALLAIPLVVVLLVAGPYLLASAQEPALPGRTGIGGSRHSVPLSRKDSGLSPTARPSPTPIPTPVRVTFTGSSSQFTGDFEVADGWILLDIEHNSSGYFGVWVKDAATGEMVALLANMIGTFAGRRMSLVEPGFYYLEVEASGPWRIVVLKLEDFETVGIPTTLTGSSSNVPAQVWSPGGRIDISMQHSGDGYFGIWLYDVTNREMYDLLANEIGNWSGSTSIPMPEGIYLLDIDTEGSWSIDMRPR